MPTPRKSLPVAEKKVIAITAWSFSRFNDYQKCPRYAKFKHVDRLPEPGSPALDRGSAIHEEGQVWAQQPSTTKKKCPENLETFEEEFRQLQKNRKSLLCEQQWALNAKWGPTGWFDKDAWLRIVVDACFRPSPLRMKVIDYKTGKINPLHEEQLGLYALGAFCTYQDLEEVEVELWYLDHGVQKPDEPTVYSRDDVPALQKEWSAKTKKMLADRSFVEKPGKACTWCHYSKGKKGPCKY